MSPAEQAKEDAIAAAMKLLTDTGAFDGVAILASSREACCGRTVYHRNVQGNAHAAEGAAREYLRVLENYQAGWHQEQGRYERMRCRQEEQERERKRKAQEGEGEDWKNG